MISARVEKLLINRDYARLWYGEAVSTVGDYVFDTTLVLWVATVLGKGRPWAPAAVSGVMLAVGAAALVVGPLAGVFVDRWDRKRTMLRTEVVRGTAVGVLAVLSFLPVSALPVGAWLGLIYALVFLVNATGQFFNPARLAVIGEVVEGDADRARAAGLGQATMATASLIGPPLAAPLLFTAGFQWALLLNALSYAFSWAAVRSVRVPAHPQPARDGAEHPDLRGEFVSGLRFFAGNRVLVVILAVAAIVACGAGAINSLDIFFVTENLHANPHIYGFMETVFGVGLIVGAVGAGAVVKRFGARNTLWFALALTGLVLVGYARQSQLWAGMLVIGLVGVPLAMVNTAVSPLVLAATPQEYLGRVMAVINPAIQLASMLSVVVAGWLASTVLQNLHARVAGMTFGRIDTVFTASGIFVLLAGLYAMVALPAGGPGQQPEAEPESAGSATRA
ncbi:MULTISPECIES: MFS transporter [Streptacidiphilus]|uniref:MFS transporter n=1 Tax=Streptacidiphilus cavernicola TaxID=3342716 RepID=A0ABV6UN35_9ACTN|nr:MFS transporter [Streptacidiphilus jeojiense]